MFFKQFSPEIPELLMNRKQPYPLQYKKPPILQLAVIK
jgi:hypothetical protein